MSKDGNLDYAQARLQARHGRRMRRSDWAHVDASRDLQHFLSTALNSPLASWTRSLNPDMDAHDLERSLRSRWRDYVTTVASWLPAAWQPALLWAGILADLQYVAELADPRPCPPWMFADPLYGSIAPGSVAERSAALSTTPLAPLASAVLGACDVREAWMREWHLRLPAMSSDVAGTLQELTAAVTEWHHAGAKKPSSLRPGTDELIQRLERIFRRSAGTPVSALAHLALIALEFQALRGLVIERSIFGQVRRVV